MTSLQVVLPNESRRTSPSRLVELALASEELGYDTVWLPDHLLPPADYGRTYGGVYEPLIMLSAIAARTTRIRVGTSVLILPLRDPFLLAKQVATLERVAAGRLILGVGLGWDATEFAAVGASFGDRGARTDEALRLIRHLHTVGHGPFEARYYGFDVGVFAPRPSARVPIMIGGTSDAALRRVARFADMWQAVGLDLATFDERIRTLRSLTDRRIEIGARIEMDEHRSPADAVAEARELGRVGADHVAVWFGNDDGFSERLAEFSHAFGNSS